MNEGKLIKLCENMPNLPIDLSTVQVYFIIGFLDQLLVLFFFLLAVLLGLRRQTLKLVHFLILVENVKIEFLNLFKELVEVLLDLLHLLYLLSCDRLLTHWISRYKRLVLPMTSNSLAIVSHSLIFALNSR